jgi:Big-like domain-containing protein
VSLVSSQNPIAFGQLVTFTATVPSGATGTIQFMNGAVNLGGPVTIAAGVAAFATYALTQGTHSITAVYSGDSLHATATSDILFQLVTPAILTVTANNVTRTFNQPNGTLGYTILVSSVATRRRVRSLALPHCPLRQQQLLLWAVIRL